MQRKRDRFLKPFRKTPNSSLAQHTPPSPSTPTDILSADPLSVTQDPILTTGAVPNRALELAIRKHLDELPEVEKDVFREASKAITQDNLLSTVRAYDEDHKRNSSFRPQAKRLSKLLNLLNRFMAGISTALQANPDPSAIIVGAVQVVISLAVEFVTFFDRLIDMLCRFADYLGPLAEYARASTDSELIQRTLADAYGDLLDFCRDARHVFIDERGVKRQWTSIMAFLRVQWDPFDRTFGDTELKFRHHVAVLGQSAQALQLKKTREAEQRETITEREKFLDWLSKFDFQKTHERMFAKKYPKTGDWLLNTTEYRTWFDSPKSSLLWCYGKPGAGKSVLASNVIEHITTEHALHDEIGISFAYYNYQSPELSDLSNIISAFMKQLCRKRDAIPSWLLKFKNDSYDSSTVSKPDSFFSLAKTFDTVFLVIDALDECTRDERHEIIRFVMEAAGKLTLAKIFVTSRRESDIVDAFESSNTPTIKIEAESVAADIELFVRAEVDRLRKGHDGKRLHLQSDTLEEKIIRALANKAEGMFLWVNLQLQHLCKVSQARKDRLVETALDETPKGLNATYTRIVHQIDNQEPYMKEIAFKCLAWVLYANRPLFQAELQDAIATKYPCRNKKNLELDEIDVILESCANLIMREGDRVIRPIHYSVREFFTKPCEGTVEGSFLEQLQKPDSIHKILATSCLWCLHLDDLAKGPCSGKWDFLHRLWENQLLDYAANFFDEHTVSLSKVDDDTLSLLKDLLERESPYLSALFQIRVSKKLFVVSIDFPVSASTIVYASRLLEIPQIAAQYAGLPIPDHALHRASDSGLVSVVSQLIEAGCKINEIDDDHSTPLYYSCREGHMEIVKRLLEGGADANAQGREYGNALQAALICGDEKIVEKLLEAGADVNAQGGKYGNALQAASRFGNEKVVEKILQAGADVNAEDGYYGNALQAASRSGNEKVVEKILQAGADVNARGGKYGNALQAASINGHEKIVEKLLQAGADVNAQGGECDNALQAASINGHEKIVKKLLQAGANVNAQGGQYGNVLRAASIYGNEKIVKKLLQAGANINAQGWYYGNALQAASSSGNEKIVEKLLQAGADVNAQDWHYGNALQAASSFGNEKIVEKLLQAGADVNAQGGYYGNALVAASASGLKDIVKLLLDAGADINAFWEGGKYGTALQAAESGLKNNEDLVPFRSNYRGVIDLLLEAGSER